MFPLAVSVLCAGLAPPAAAALSRAVLLRRSALLVAPVPLWTALHAVAEEPPPALATGEEGVVMRGVLQMEPALVGRMQPGATASVSIRVVGRNTKGPLATVAVPLEGKTFPIEYAVQRSSLRDGLADFVWLEEDIYVFAEAVSATGKKLAEGRSKAKFVRVDGEPAHKIAALLLE